MPKLLGQCHTIPETHKALTNPSPSAKKAPARTGTIIPSTTDGKEAVSSAGGAGGASPLLVLSEISQLSAGPPK